jgi:CRP-like cAMP-binding protein
MKMLALRPAIENKLLKNMRPDDFALLAPNLIKQEFAVRYQIEAPDTPISDVLFLENGLASIVANKISGRDVEVAIAGIDGMTGVSVVLGALQTPYSAYIQIAANGHKISANALRSAMAQSETMRDYLLLYVQALIVQTTSTALANSQYLVEARLARWLLMVHDRTNGNDLLITHEFLSIMLGARRPYVTAALHVLESQRLIRSKRGQITIVDRRGLILLADGCYGVAEREYERLFASQQS